ncbi:MAG: M23 family peptidase, partial [Arenibacter sp.]
MFYGQTPYPTDYFRSPLDIPIVLSGTFGELRSNHFHAGIDIKTQQRQGLPVYAIGEGTV